VKIQGSKIVFGQNKRHHGFLVIEITAALAILAILMIGLALSLDGSAKFNRYMLLRQQCTAAAQAQLDSLAVTGKAIREPDFKRLWPGLNVSIEQAKGTGTWEGMKRVEVTASGSSGRRQVQVRLSRYILAEDSN
jgi:type II secretory pathway pseudopilin PulG